MLVGNKTDLPAERKVSVEEGVEKANAEDVLGLNRQGTVGGSHIARQIHRRMSDAETSLPHGC